MGFPTISFKRCLYRATRDFSCVAALVCADYALWNYYIMRIYLPKPGETNTWKTFCLVRRVKPDSVSIFPPFFTGAGRTEFLKKLKDAKAVIIEPCTGRRLVVKVIGVGGDLVHESSQFDGSPCPGSHSEVVPKNYIWISPIGTLNCPKVTIDCMSNFVYFSPSCAANIRQCESHKKSLFIHASHLEGVIVSPST